MRSSQTLLSAVLTVLALTASVEDECAAGFELFDLDGEAELGSRAAPKAPEVQC